MLLDDILAAGRRGDIELLPFTNSAVFNTLGASATAAVSISIDADSDFVARQSMLMAYSAAGTNIALPDYLITLFDAGSGRNMQNVAQHVGNVMGTAQRPYIWPEPWLVKGGGTVTVTLTNNTATAARVDAAFGGFKVFYLRGYSRAQLFGLK